MPLNRKHSKEVLLSRKNPVYYLEVQCHVCSMRPWPIIVFAGGHRHKADVFPNLIFQSLQRPEHHVRCVAARRPYRDLHCANLPVLIALHRSYLDLDLGFLGAGAAGGAPGKLLLERLVLLLQLADL